MGNEVEPDNCLRVSRRAFLATAVTGAGCGALADSGWSRGEQQASGSAGNAGGKAEHDRRLVLSHWHFFPLSIDNRPATDDYYSKEYLGVSGERGKHSAYGGFLRDRPIPRPPDANSDWQRRDARKDIRYALDAGLDGFHYNLTSVDPRGGAYRRLQMYLDASTEVSGEFRLGLCLDCSVIDFDANRDGLIYVCCNVLKHVSALRWFDERPMLSCFYAERWSPRQWETLLTRLSRCGIDVFFAPMFLDVGKATEDYLSVIDMLGVWAGNHIGSTRALRRVALRARDRGKSFMWPVWPQDCRPKSGWFSEARNSALFREGWEAAIDSGPECVNVLTWNDYSENSHLRPSLRTQYGFADLNAYFSSLYKGGTEVIEKDAVYCFHRIDFAKDPKVTGRGRAMRANFGAEAVDRIEVVAFLSAPGDIVIENSKGVVRCSAGKGVTSCFASLETGKVAARLIRGGLAVLNLESPFAVRKTCEWQNLLYHSISSQRRVEGIEYI